MLGVECEDMRRQRDALLIKLLRGKPDKQKILLATKDAFWLMNVLRQSAAPHLSLGSNESMATALQPY